MTDIMQQPPKPELIKLPDPTDSAGVVVTPPGFQAHSIEPYVKAFLQRQPAPERRRGIYQAAEIASLLAWVKDNCANDAPIFASGAEDLAETWACPELALVAIGNYSNKMTPQWHDFEGIYNFPITKAWKEWTAKSHNFMKQGEFAEHVEEHLYEFSAPQSGEVLSEAVTRMIEALGGTKYVATPSDMYALAHGVKIYIGQEVEVTLDRSTGEQQLHFTETHTGKGDRPVTIPKFFYIRVPVFFGEPPVLVGALLRYRNAGGGVVMWSYELFAPDLIVKDAFDAACKVVTDAGRTLYLGTPDKPED